MDLTISKKIGWKFKIDLEEGFVNTYNDFLSINKLFYK